MCLPCTRQHESNLREGFQLKEISTLVRRKYRQEEKGKKKNKREKARKGVWGGLILERKQGSVYLTTSCFPINLTKERAQEIALILGQLLLPVSRELLPIIPICVRASAAAVTKEWGGGAMLINQGCQRQAKGTHRYQIHKSLFFKVLTFCLLFLKVSITRATHFC